MWKKGRNDARGAGSYLLLMTNMQHHYHLTTLRKQNFSNASVQAHRQHVNRHLPGTVTREDSRSKYLVSKSSPEPRDGARDAGKKSKLVFLAWRRQGAPQKLLDLFSLFLHLPPIKFHYSHLFQTYFPCFFPPFLMHTFRLEKLQRFCSPKAAGLQPLGTRGQNEVLWPFPASTSPPHQKTQLSKRFSHFASENDCRITRAGSVYPHGRSGMEPGGSDRNSLCGGLCDGAGEKGKIGGERGKKTKKKKPRQHDKGNVFLDNHFKRLLGETQGQHVPREAWNTSKATSERPPYSYFFPHFCQ